MKQYKPGDRGYDILPPERDASGVGETLPMQRTDAAIPDVDLSAWDPGWGARHRGRAVARTLIERTAGLEILRQYTGAAAAFEESYQQLLAAQARRRAIPLVAQREILGLEAEIAKGRGELESIVDLYADHRARRLERRELEAETHELELARRRRLLLEEQTAIRQLEARLKNGSAPHPESNAVDPDGTDAFNESLRTETEVRRNRSKADDRIEAIYRRAAAERRQLSPIELDEIAAIEGASDAAEAHIRRGGAADF